MKKICLVNLNISSYQIRLVIRASKVIVAVFDRYLNFFLYFFFKLIVNEKRICYIWVHAAI